MDGLNQTLSFLPSQQLTGKVILSKFKLLSTNFTSIKKSLVYFYHS